MYLHLEEDVISAYVNEGMTPDEKISVQNHVAECRECLRAITIERLSGQVNRRIRALLFDEDDSTLAAC